jgi:hypothetical protein
LPPHSLSCLVLLYIHLPLHYPSLPPPFLRPGIPFPGASWLLLLILVKCMFPR